MSLSSSKPRLLRFMQRHARKQQALLPIDFQKYQKPIMQLSLSIGPLVSLIAGILILIMPRLLNFIVALYLILIGLIGLFGLSSMRF